MTNILSQSKQVFQATNSIVIISKPKKLLNFFLNFGNLDKISNTLKKSMALRGDFFLKLKTAKNRVT